MCIWSSARNSLPEGQEVGSADVTKVLDLQDVTFTNSRVYAQHFYLPFQIVSV